MSELAFDHIKPSAENTKINLHPDVKASGVKLVEETAHNNDLHLPAAELGGAVTKDATPVEFANGELPHETFEDPNKLPVIETGRWDSTLKDLVNAKSIKRGNHVS